MTDPSTRVARPLRFSTSTWRSGLAGLSLLALAPLGCGSGGDSDGADVAAASGSAVVRQEEERYSVRIEAGDPDRLVAEVNPKAPWTFDMDFASEMRLGESVPRPADRIASNRILFDVARASGSENPRSGTLRFSLCRDRACEPVEHEFRLR